MITSMEFDDCYYGGVNLITIFLFSISMMALGTAVITASKSSVLEKKILELEKELKELKDSNSKV